MTREKIAEIFAKVGIDTTGLSKDFAMLKSILRTGLRTALVGLGAGLSIAGITTKLAADAEETANLFKLVFKQATDKVIADLNRFGEAAGRGRNELKKYAAGFGALLNPMGFTTDEVAKLSTQLSILGSDMSSFFNTSDEDAAFALTSALTGQIRPMRRYGVNISKAAVEQNAFAMGLIKTKKELTQKIKVMSTLNIIMRETKQLENDAINTQASLTNQWRRFRGAMQDIGVEVGKVFRPMATQLFTMLGQMLGPLSKNQALFEVWAKVLNDELKKVIAAFSEAGSAIYRAFVGSPGGVPTVTGAIELVSSGLQYLANTITKLMTSEWASFIAGIVKSIPSITGMTVAVGALETAIASVAAIFTTTALASLLNPITLISVAIVGLTAAMLDAKYKGQTWADSIAEWTATLFGFENAVTAANASIKANSESSRRLRGVSERDKATQDALEAGTMTKDQLRGEIDTQRQALEAEKQRKEDSRKQLEAVMKQIDESNNRPYAVQLAGGDTLTAQGLRPKQKQLEEDMRSADMAAEAIQRKIDVNEGQYQSLGMRDQAKADEEKIDAQRKETVKEAGKSLLELGRSVSSRAMYQVGHITDSAVQALKKGKEAAAGVGSENAVARAKGILGLSEQEFSEMLATSQANEQERLAKEILAKATGLDPALLDKKEEKRSTAQFMGLADYVKSFQSAIGGTPEIKLAKKTADNTGKTAQGVEKMAGGIKDLAKGMLDWIKEPARAT